MPFVVYCPTCRLSLTVMESPAAYVITCPACRHGLAVPAVAVVATVTPAPVPPPTPPPEPTSPFEELDGEPDIPRRAARRTPRPSVVFQFFAVVGLLALTLSMRTRRPQNGCRRCGRTWYPRGHHLSANC